MTQREIEIALNVAPIMMHDNWLSEMHAIFFQLTQHPSTSLTLKND